MSAFFFAGMDGVDAGAPIPGRRWLKRRFPGIEHEPMDQTAGRPRTRSPRAEPLARPVPATSAPSKDPAEHVARPNDPAILVSQPPTEPGQEDDPARLSPQALVRLLGAVQPMSARFRRVYKTLWTRMHRHLCAIKARSVMSEAERAFAEEPGVLVTQKRMALWLVLREGPDADRPAFMYRAGKLGRPCGSRSLAHAWLREKVVMLTWNGEWGVFTGKVAAHGGVDAVAARVREHADMKALLKEFGAFVRRQVGQIRGAVHWALAFDVSPSVLSDQIVRVDTYLVLVRAGGRKGQGTIVIQSPELFTFRGCRPNVASSVASRVSTRTNNGMSLFNVLVPKIGNVCSDSSVRLYHDVEVKPTWAFHLLQQEKISLVTAREVIRRCAKNVPRMLAILDKNARARCLVWTRSSMLTHGLA